MLKIIDRYILKNLFYSYLLCFLALMGLYIISDAFSRVDNFMKEGSFIINFIIYYSATAPGIYYNMSPIIFVLAATITLSRLTRTNEIIAMRAAGISISRISKPLIMASIIACILIAVVQEKLLPALAGKIRLTRYEPIESIHVSDIEGNVIFIEKYYPNKKEVENISVTGFYKSGKKKFYMKAASGIAEKKSWRLLSVKKYDFTEDGALIMPAGSAELPCSLLPKMFFETDIVPTDLESMDKDVNYLSLNQLFLQYRRQPENAGLRVQIHSRFAYPLSTFVLLLLGIPFAVRQSRHAVFLSSIVCVFLCVAYFVVSFFFEERGSLGTISPLAAVWLPPLVFTCLGVTLLDSVKT
ncbi:MAG: LptF/LptG family permease [Planctomycetota bacterium]